MRPGLVDYDENISHLLARKQHMAALFFAKIWPFKFNKIYQIAYFLPNLVQFFCKHLIKGKDY